MNDPTYNSSIHLAHALATLGSQAFRTTTDVRTKPDPSASSSVEVCPNCGDEHRSDKHIFCSPECFDNHE